MTHMPVTKYVKWAILADVQSAIITSADIRQNRQTIRLVKMPNKSSCNADVWIIQVTHMLLLAVMINADVHQQHMHGP